MSRPRCVVLIAAALLLTSAPWSMGAPPATPAQPTRDLPDEAILRLGTLTLRHSATVQRVAFSHDGKTLATVSRGEFVLWDLAAGRRRTAFHATDRDRIDTRVSSFALSPDDRFLAASISFRLHLWNLATGEEVGAGARPRSNVQAVAFSPDGKTLAVGCHDGTLLWDLKAAKEIRILPAAPSTLTSLAFSPDGKALAASSRTPDVLLWDTATGRTIRRFTDTGKEFDFVAFSGDGASLAASGTYNTCVWDVASGRIRFHLEGNRGTVGSAALSGDGKALAVGGSHGEASLQWFDVVSGKEIRRLGPERGGLYNVALSPDGKTVAAGSWSDNRPHLYDVPTGEELYRDDGHQYPVLLVAFSPDGRTLLSGARQFRLWDARTGEQFRRFGGYAWSAAFSPDGKAVATGDQSKVLMWDTATGRLSRTLDGAGHALCTGVAFSGDGKLLAAAGTNDLSVYLWDLAAGAAPRRCLPKTANKGETTCSCVTLAPDGKTVAARIGCNTYLWDAVTTRQLWVAALPPPVDRYNVACLTFSPDGKLLASAAGSHVFFRDPATGEILRHFQAFAGRINDRVRSLVFSPDGKTLASAGDDGIIRLWEVATGRQRREVNAAAICLSISPDGRVLASSHADTTVLLWDLTGRLRGGRLPAMALRPGELEDLWAVLGREDATAAYRAVWDLVVGAKQSLPFLKAQVRPVPAAEFVAERRRIARWIADLDDDKFANRQQASSGLAGLGWKVRPDLQRALRGDPSSEVRRRIETILQRLEEQGPSLDERRRPRILEVLEHVDSAQARDLLADLARGAPDAPLTQEAKASLTRLAKRHALLPSE